jgi:CPA1 family monovalent cation:H+ antiporter
MMKRIDHYRTEVLITLALVMGGYSIAHYWHFSGPLAMVATGLFIGRTGHGISMSDITADYVNKFWEMLDEVLNAVLFVLIGLELMVVEFKTEYILIGGFATLVVIGARYIALAIPSYLFKYKETFEPYTLQIMTWGGLRGGISIALALSLDSSMEYELIVAITYMVVLFSLAIQGLTIERFVKRLKVRAAREEA